MLLAALALEAAEHALTGLEYARGIPGSVGGAVRMNAELMAEILVML